MTHIYRKCCRCGRRFEIDDEEDCLRDRFERDEPPTEPLPELPIGELN